MIDKCHNKHLCPFKHFLWIITPCELAMFQNSLENGLYVLIKWSFLHEQNIQLYQDEI